ncbi:pyridoxamine 5'-phosphate oxidase family protein [uncultured Amnibacterium sp.]|uniref:pyridoxamine 5'-phosphate oxidase family protein n=1 Tax=uncultured Amnibacterium sp. TaxID=1631851 RepID=UPI0035CC5EEA
MTDTKDDQLQQLATLIDKAKIGLITTVNAEGHLVSRPMAVKEREFDGDLWFFTEDPSHKTDEVRAVPEVNVALESNKGWVSIAGTAEIVTDQAKIDELWDTAAAAWFEQGRDDPKVALLKVTAHTAEVWASDQPKPLILLRYAKAAVTGGQPNVGESHVIDLD